MIEIKSLAEIQLMRNSGKLAAECLVNLQKEITEGITTQDIDDLVADFFKGKNAICAPLGYRGSDNTNLPFPKSCCTSINEVVCHGIPGKTRLKNGDIVNIDVTCILDGYHGDTSQMFIVGKTSSEAERLVRTTQAALYAGISEIKPGNRLGSVGFAIEQVVNEAKFSIVRGFVGHGIGRKFHDEPKVFHHGPKGLGPRLIPGMTFTVEPMVNMGSPDVSIDETDGWTVTTVDKSWSAQWEHTLLVTNDGFEILTEFT